NIDEAESTRSGGDVSTPLAWSGSIVLHLVILVIASLITWSIVQTPDDRPIVVVSSPDAVPTFESVTSVTTLPSESSSMGGAPTVSASQPVEAADLADLLVAADDLMSQSTVLAATPGAGETPGVSFGGVAAPAATRIVFVVDASGSMIGAFRAVIREVERTLRQLDSRQSFTVLLFQGDRVLSPKTLRGGLRPATPAAVDAVVEWMRDANPKDQSDPSKALKEAFSLDPQVVYLVSTDITGTGNYEVDREQLFTLLEKLNPRRGDGRRDTLVRCIQLLDEDRLGTLREIARRHGVDPEGKDESGFAFIGRSALGLE
ncbi:MAG: hypothetical protein RLZZ461_2009, partial [Planctomycetota bacterium]